MGQQVQMPNGDIVEMPDNPTPQQLQQLAAIQQKQANPSFGDQVMTGLGKAGDFLKNIGTAAYKGIADLAAGAGDALAGSYDYTDAARASMGLPVRQLTPNAVSEALDKTGYQPKDRTEQITANIVRAMAGAATNPQGIMAGGGNIAKVMAQNALIGAASGAGGEAAGAVVDNPYARLVGSLIGGGVAGTANAIRQSSNTASIAKKALSDVSPKDLETAKANMLQAQEAGVPINLSQAMPKGSNIDAIVETLANNSYGRNISKMLQSDQPTNVAMALEGQLAGVPGEIAPSMQAPANAVNQAATSVVGAAKRARTAEFQQTLQDVGIGMPKDVPEQAVQSAYQKLGATAAQYPNTALGDMLSTLQGKLLNGDNLITDANQLNEIFKETANSLKSPDLATKGIDAGRANYMRQVIDTMRNDLGDAFEPLRQANAGYRANTEEIINPLKQSVVGRLATARGAKPDVEASTARLQGLFDRGTVPGSPQSEIIDLADALKNVSTATHGIDGPEAFQNAAKTWLADKLSKVQSPSDSRVQTNAAQRFVQMFGNGQQPTAQSQGLKDVLAGVARTQGVPEATYVQGMENLSKVIGMAARRPATVQGVNEAALNAMASGSPVSIAGRTRTGLLPNLAERWNAAIRADAYSTMDRLLTSPEGVDMLKQLAAGNPTDPKIQAAVSTFLGTQSELAGDNYGK